MFFDFYELNAQHELLKTACESGLIENVKLILKEYWHSLENARKNCLHWAVSSGELDLCRCLISEFKIDVNCEDKYLYTPLHVAAQYGHLQIVILLCENGAKIDVFTNSGFTPGKKIYTHINIVSRFNVLIFFFFFFF